MIRKDVIVIGGGAAGLFCAIEAGKRNRSVIVLERAEKVGKKIAISGGGRCNFTNIDTGPENFLSANSNFCRSALARYTPYDFIALIEKHAIRYHEKKLGQLFCDTSSGEIIRMLLKECADAGAQIQPNCDVREIKKDSAFTLDTNHGVIEADSVVIATGGLSIPKIGATDFGYAIARQFGLNVTTLKPALVPLTFDSEDKDFFAALSGISLDAIVTFDRQQFRENILTTHRGLSGPAILQISSYWDEQRPISINLLPDLDASEILLARYCSEIELATLVGQYLPKRFAQQWCDRQVSSKPLSRYSERELREIANTLHDWRVQPAGTEGYKKAEVTRGGVDTAELSSKTMEAKKVHGLYFIGEVVDVTGQLGGYNFQWAWASGFAAGQYV
jgi:predicted Rossmann fold flavoprotein